VPRRLYASHSPTHAFPPFVGGPTSFSVLVLSPQPSRLRRAGSSRRPPESNPSCLRRQMSWNDSAAPLHPSPPPTQVTGDGRAAGTPNLEGSLRSYRPSAGLSAARLLFSSNNERDLRLGVRTPTGFSRREEVLLLYSGASEPQLLYRCPITFRSCRTGAARRPARSRLFLIPNLLLRSRPFEPVGSKRAKRTEPATAVLCGVGQRMPTTIDRPRFFFVPRTPTE